MKIAGAQIETRQCQVIIITATATTTTTTTTTAIGFTLGGSSPYTSTDRTNKKMYT